MPAETAGHTAPRRWFSAHELVFWPAVAGRQPPGGGRSDFSKWCQMPAASATTEIIWNSGGRNDFPYRNPHRAPKRLRPYRSRNRIRHSRAPTRYGSAIRCESIRSQPVTASRRRWPGRPHTDDPPETLSGTNPRPNLPGGRALRSGSSSQGCEIPRTSTLPSHLNSVLQPSGFAGRPVSAASIGSIHFGTAVSFAAAPATSSSSVIFRPFATQRPAPAPCRQWPRTGDELVPRRSRASMVGRARRCRRTG